MAEVPADGSVIRKVWLRYASGSGGVLSGRAAVIDDVVELTKVNANTEDDGVVSDIG